MKKSAAALATAVAVLAMAALSGAALAGDNNGHGHGSAQQQQGQSSSTSSDQQAGVKPSNDTKKDQTCTTGGGQGSSATCQSSTYPGKADSSKRYGNGKTAVQIANGKGAPAGTPIYGPGNSQPHKICGRDVHAYKGGSCQSKQTEHVSAQVNVASTVTPAPVAPAAVKPAAVAPAAVAPAPAPPATVPPAPAVVTQHALAATSGVLGASKTLPAPALTPASAPAGVLGTLKTLGTGTLPFTGLRLWIVALVALGLIGTGVATRMLARRGA